MKSAKLTNLNGFYTLKSYIVDVFTKTPNLILKSHSQLQKHPNSNHTKSNTKNHQQKAKNAKNAEVPPNKNNCKVVGVLLLRGGIARGQREVHKKR
jgi:hypothetical protein